MAQSLGRIVVPLPGTIVHLSAVRIACHAVMIEALPGNTGKIYGGQAGFVKGVSGENFILALPSLDASGKPVSLPTFSETISAAPNALDLQGYWIDADVAGDGVLVSYVVW